MASSDIAIAREFLKVIEKENTDELTVNIPFKRWIQLAVADKKRSEAQKATLELQLRMKEASINFALFLKKVDDDIGLSKYIDLFNDLQDKVELYRNPDGYIMLRTNDAEDKEDKS